MIEKDGARILGMSAFTAQQFLIGVMGLAFSIVVFRSDPQLTYSQIAGKLQLILLAFAIGSLLQIAYFKKIAVGSGMFLPPISGAIYVQPSIVAIAIGGIPLLIGMTIFAGFCEFLLSFVVRKIRFIFPPEICGLVLLLVGLDLAVVGIQSTYRPPYSTHFIVFIATLLPILAISVWIKGHVRHLASLIGVAVGVIVLLALGGWNSIAAPTVSWVHWPPIISIFELHMKFDWALLLPFFLVGFTAFIRTTGLCISMQQATEKDWKHPNYPLIKRALRADGVAALIAGLLGLNGLNVSPTATTLAIASKCTEKTIIYLVSAAFIVLAFLPKFLFYIVAAPLPIVGAILFYYAAFIFTGGVRIIGLQAFGIRQIFIVGISFCVSFSTVVVPSLYAQLPYPFNFFGKSSLFIGVTVALILNLLFYVGKIRAQRFTLRLEDQPDQVIYHRVMSYGQAWGIGEDLVKNTIMVATEITEQINHAGLAKGEITVDVKDNPMEFTIILSYSGQPYKINVLDKADVNKMLDEEMLVIGIKTHLRGIAPSRTSTSQDGDACEISLTFKH